MLSDRFTIISSQCSRVTQLQSTHDQKTHSLSKLQQKTRGCWIFVGILLFFSGCKLWSKLVLLCPNESTWRQTSSSQPYTFSNSLLIRFKLIWNSFWKSVSTRLAHVNSFFALLLLFLGGRGGEFTEGLGKLSYYCWWLWTKTNTIRSRADDFPWLVSLSFHISTR